MLDAFLLNHQSRHLIDNIAFPVSCLFCNYSPRGEGEDGERGALTWAHWREKVWVKKAAVFDHLVSAHPLASIGLFSDIEQQIRGTLLAVTNLNSLSLPNHTGAAGGSGNSGGPVNWAPPGGPPQPQPPTEFERPGRDPNAFSEVAAPLPWPASSSLQGQGRGGKARPSSGSRSESYGTPPEQQPDAVPEPSSSGAKRSRKARRRAHKRLSAPNTLHSPAPSV